MDPMGMVSYNIIMSYDYIISLYYIIILYHYIVSLYYIIISYHYITSLYYIIISYHYIISLYQFIILHQYIIALYCIIKLYHYIYFTFLYIIIIHLHWWTPDFCIHQQGKNPGIWIHCQHFREVVPPLQHPTKCLKICWPFYPSKLYTWIYLRCLEKVTNILPTGGLKLWFTMVQSAKDHQLNKSKIAILPPLLGRFLLRFLDMPKKKSRVGRGNSILNSTMFRIHS